MLRISGNKQYIKYRCFYQKVLIVKQSLMKGESLPYDIQNSNFKWLANDIPLKIASTEANSYFSISSKKNNILISVCCYFSGLQSLKIKGQLTHANGTPFHIPSPYWTVFLSVVNKSDNELLKYRQMNDEIPFINFFGQFKLQHQECQCVNQVWNQKISKEIRHLLMRTQQALIALGIIKPVTKKVIELRKCQLQLKRNFVKVLKSQDIIMNQKPMQKQSILKHVNSIEQIIPTCISFNSEKGKRGGTFQVDKKKFIVTQNCKIKYEKSLAEKKVRRQGNHETTNRKIMKQFEIIERIGNSKHFLKYWKQFGSFHPIYMDYVPQTLKAWLRKGNKSVEQIIKIYQQVLDSVNQLHRVNVVHRDIKPENFLVKEEMGGQIVKIIDFGESGLMDEPLQKSVLPLGYTLPYSPFQCIYNNEQGVKRKEIDSWSLGFLLFQLTYRYWPMTYIQPIGKDIVESWIHAQGFQLYMNFRKKGGIFIIEEIISYTIACCLKIKQRQRLSLDKLKNIIQLIKHSVQKISNCKCYSFFT